MYTTARESGTYTISYVTKLQLIQWYIYHSALAKLNKPGAVARSDPRPPGMRADGRGFDPHDRQHSFVETGHEIISTAILSLPLIQEGQLTVTGEGMCTGKLPSRPAQEKRG